MADEKTVSKTLTLPAGRKKPVQKSARHKPVRKELSKAFSENVEKIIPRDTEALRQTAPLVPEISPKKNQDIEHVRVSKLMAARGMCSRREADAFIEKGWVFVDGKRVTALGTRVAPTSSIVLDKTAKELQKKQVTILLHKPVGFVSGQPEPGFTPAVTLIKPENQWKNKDVNKFHYSHLQGLAPAGRLDVDSSGLLVLTQDGRIARTLIGEHSNIDKEYLVRVEGALDAKGLALLNHGLSLDDKALKPAKVVWLNEDQLHFTLKEGRKRQIRRMCELVGLKVIGLKRVRIGKIHLANLPLGQWRYLQEDESF